MKNRILPAIIVLTIAIYPGVSSAKSTTGGKITPAGPQPAVPKVLQREPTLSVSPASVLQRLKADKKPVLVDIRHARDFNRFKIPDSINIPLHFIKTKAFLKTRHLVLVHPGRTYRLLETHCRELRKAGFNVSIMEGGLNAWRSIGGPLVGDPFAPRELTRMSAREYYYEQAYQNIVPIYFDAKLDQKRSIGITHPHNVTLSDNAYNTGEMLKSLSRCGQQDCRNAAQVISPLLIVLFDETGEAYSRLEKIARDAGLSNLLFLEGGRAAYRAFIEQRTLAGKSRKDRIRTTGGCVTCGPVKQPSEQAPATN